MAWNGYVSHESTAHGLPQTTPIQHRREYDEVFVIRTHSCSSVTVKIPTILEENILRKVHTI